MGLAFDKDTYEAAKPEFIRAWEHAKNAGFKIKELIQYLADQFDAAIRPYLMRFMKDVRDNTLTINGESVTIGEKETEEDGTISTDTTGSPEESGTGEVQEDDEGERPPGSEDVLSDEGEPGEQGESEPDENADGERGPRDGAERPSDYSITPDDRLGAGGAKTKYSDNIRAIRTLKKIESENRQATPEEQAILVKYVGWGGIPQAFPYPDGSIAKGWEGQVPELREVLGRDEYNAARKSTRNAHYSSESIITAIYKGLSRLGVSRGKFLEPSVGTGNFIGLMPEGVRRQSRVTGIELDITTAAIARHLYPNQNIVQNGFQNIEIEPGSYDVAIGNPPFGQEKLFDPNYKQFKTFSIHNYFFAKSLDALHENGVLAMVVSSSMMDKIGDTQRTYIRNQAELLGAIRLPNNAFKGNAGTEVTTDIIFLRKRAKGEKVTGPKWQHLKTVEGKEFPVKINEYFADHPEMVLGEFVHNKLTPGAAEFDNDGVYKGVPGLEAAEGVDVETELHDRLNNLPENVYERRVDYEGIQDPDVIVSDPGFAMPFGYAIDDQGRAVRRLPDRNGEQRFEIAIYGKKKPGPITGKRLEIFKGLIGLREDVRRLIRAEVGNDPKMEDYRATLNDNYDAFVEKHGYISNPSTAQILKDDPVDIPLLKSLEVDFDKGVSKAVSESSGKPQRPQSAKKAAIFSERTREPYRKAKKADNAKDGLLIVLREDGVVDLDHVQDLTGMAMEDIVSELNGVIFMDPQSKKWETAETYLSGNVKQKLEIANYAKNFDSQFAANVEALEKVIPDDVPPEDMQFRIGANWIPSNIYEAFARDEVGVDVTIFHHGASGTWANKVNTENPQSKYTVPEMNAGKMFIRTVGGQALNIYYTDADGTRRLDREASQVAKNMANDMHRDFKDWVFSRSDVRELVNKLFNDKVNTTIDSTYDGSHMIFPGMGIINAGVKRDDQLRQHQKDGVWRNIQKGKGLADEVVGSGKTFEAIATGLEMKRMGLLNKPMYVVPNHLIEQWAGDFQKLYPGANVLAITRNDFSKQKRQEFLARIATGNWDAVLMAHSSFGFIKVPTQYVMGFYQRQLDELREALVELRQIEGDRSFTVKQMEAAETKLTEKMRALSDSATEDVVDFSELGVDALFVDEAHEFKNLIFGLRRFTFRLCQGEM